MQDCITRVIANACFTNKLKEFSQKMLKRIDLSAA